MGDEDNEFQSPSDLPEPEGIGDSYKNTNFNNLLDELNNTIDSDTKKDTNKNKMVDDFVTKNNQMNQKTKKMISEMDNIIGDSETLKNKVGNIDDVIEYDDLDDLVD